MSNLKPSVGQRLLHSGGDIAEIVEIDSSNDQVKIQILQINSDGAFTIGQVKWSIEIKANLPWDKQGKYSHWKYLENQDRSI